MASFALILALFAGEAIQPAKPPRPPGISPTGEGWFWIFLGPGEPHKIWGRKRPDGQIEQLQAPPRYFPLA